MDVDLRPYTDADLALSIALETDAVAMAELGGPRAEEDIRAVHRRRVGGRWSLVIVDGDGAALGSLFVWESDHHGSAIHEIGWMVLPHAHGRGVASAALRLLLGRIRASGELTELHAFPGVTNAPSNRLCASAGFTAAGDEDVDFAGHALRCRHWVLDVTVPAPHRAALADLAVSPTAALFQGRPDAGTDVSVFVTRTPPGRAVDLHVHPYPETFVLLAGRGRWTVGATAHELVPDELVVVPADTPHGFRNVGDEPLLVVSVHERGRLEQTFLGLDAL